jgi:hypothetical protein
LRFRLPRYPKGAGGDRNGCWRCRVLPEHGLLWYYRTLHYITKKLLSSNLIHRQNGKYFATWFESGSEKNRSVNGETTSSFSEKRNSQQLRATRAGKEEKGGSVVELRPDNVSSSSAEPPSGGPSGAASGTLVQQQNDVVREMLRNPPNWLATELRLCLVEPHRLPVNTVATNIATAVYGSPWDWRKVLPLLRAHLGDGMGDAS